MSGGPVSGGPVSGGPVSGGPVSGGPVSGGPVSGGPVSGGPHPRHEAAPPQIAAADPGQSTWLTANAGSGKTRVLTDRVARLLLAGSAPQRILCLTYTKAAATEMQNRLLARLGEWAMLPDAALRAALADLGVDPATADLAEARRLFARAIETPGGLKVQTIHSFCAGVLRRFPLEAGVPFAFQELDERSATVLRAAVVEAMAIEGDPAFADLTALHGGHDLDRFLARVAARDFSRPPDAAAIWASVDLPPGFSEADLLAEVFLGGEAALMAEVLPVLRGGATNSVKLAEALAGVNWAAPGPGDLDLLCRHLLYGAKTAAPFAAKLDDIPARPLRAALAAQLDALHDLMRRVEAARPRRLALGWAGRSLRLARFGHAFTTRYGARKAAQGWLDFDDLIGRTAALLADPAMALWVLWRLDGGIDHILVDEAQDTSPGQWQVIRALSAEFTSGMGARDPGRTLFVVGDPKQSIYSFQGADIEVFQNTRDAFIAALTAAGQPVQERGLRHSFRSAPAILALVDAVFRGAAAAGLGGPPRHHAFRDGLPGRIDLWPPLPAPGKPEPGPWWQPVDAPLPPSAETDLAAAIAARIRALLEAQTPIPVPRDGSVRPITPGDILILVRRRSTLFHALIAACKAAGVPIAGADRLKLSAELAVDDIRATLAFIATPEDDLSLAAALKSPLFGLTEDDLYRLAAPRPGTLWQALRDSPHAGAAAILADLMGQADFLRPHDLIARLLTRHRGRARLIARLGDEAEDGIAELSSQALAYEAVETPSLTGFLVWLAGDEVEVRRQAPGTGGGLVRVMTVHGAKGLEAPVVILPDTAIRESRERGEIVALNGRPGWRGRADERPQPVADAVAAERERALREERRLLYVALTRAESWLIVAAAGETGTGTDSWHAMVSDGAGVAGLDQSLFEVPGIGQALRLSSGDWPAAAPPAAGAAAAPMALPPWADAPAARAPRPPRPIAATGLGGAAILAPGAAGPDGLDGAGERETALLRGTRLHLLLDQLAGLAPADRAARAQAALAGAEGGLPDPAELALLLAEAVAVLDAPDLAGVMGPPPPGATVLTEVALTAPLAGRILHGAIDRLIVLPDRLLAVDFKSNAAVPARPEHTPDGILRQMAAYRAALAAIWPGRPVAMAVLWTANRTLMALPDPLLDTAMAAALADLDPGRPRA